MDLVNLPLFTYLITKVIAAPSGTLKIRESGRSGWVGSSGVAECLTRVVEQPVDVALCDDGLL